MSIEKFCFQKLKQLFKDGPLRDNQDAKNYLDSYIIPLTNGAHAKIEGDEMEMIKKEEFRDVYAPRFPPQIKKYYFHETIPRYIICDVHKPMITKNYINVCKPYKHKYQEYDTFDKKTKEGVELMLSYIREVWADDVNDSYIYLLNWLANMAQGNKNISCIYNKNVLEGTGKSTFTEFISEYVMGYDLSVKGKADHLKGDHNYPLMGKLFVYFEELQIFSKAQWVAIDSELKDIITSKLGSYTDKYKTRVESNNINNIMITTNNNWKGVHGRRYFCCDSSMKYMGDNKYFNNLKKKCFNDLVGKAFFSYLQEIDVSEFNSAIMPQTKHKLDLIAEQLLPIEKFLKFEFLLQNKSINDKVINLCSAFKGYHANNPFINNEKFNSISFNSLMREIGFNCYKSNGYYKYNISVESLKKFADKRKWIHEFDSIENNEESEKTNDVKTCLNGDGVVLSDNDYEEYLFLKAEKKARDKKGGVMIPKDEYEEFKAYKEKVDKIKPTTMSVKNKVKQIKEEDKKSKLSTNRVKNNKNIEVNELEYEVEDEDDEDEEEEEEEEDDPMKEEDEEKPIKKIKDLKDSEIDDLEFNF